MALLTYRFIEAGWRVLQSRQTLLVASHEAEEMVEEAAKSGDADKEG